MTKTIRNITTATLIAFCLSALTTQAEEANDGEQADEQYLKMSPEERQAYVEKKLKEIDGMMPRILELKASATKSRDLIKQNCVNDNLISFKKILSLAEKTRNDLLEDISAGDTQEQSHAAAKIDMILARALQTSADAEACIGDELMFVGDGDVTVEGPSIVVEPIDPLVPTVVPFTRPGYASPFF